MHSQEATSVLTERQNNDPAPACDSPVYEEKETEETTTDYFVNMGKTPTPIPENQQTTSVSDAIENIFDHSHKGVSISFVRSLTRFLAELLTGKKDKNKNDEICALLSNLRHTVITERKNMKNDQEHKGLHELLTGILSQTTIRTQLENLLAMEEEKEQNEQLKKYDTSTRQDLLWCLWHANGRSITKSDWKSKRKTKRSIPPSQVFTIAKGCGHTPIQLVDWDIRQQQARAEGNAPQYQAWRNMYNYKGVNYPGPIPLSPLPNTPPLR